MLNTPMHKLFVCLHMSYGKVICKVYTTGQQQNNVTCTHTHTHTREEEMLLCDSEGHKAFPLIWRVDNIMLSGQ